MRIGLNIPDEMAAQIAAAGRDLPRAALEALTLEEYRSEKLSESEIRQLRGFETRIVRPSTGLRWLTFRYQGPAFPGIWLPANVRC